MKRKALLFSLLLATIGLVAFTSANSTEGDLVKVSVVHHEGNTIMVLDTVFDPASGYSVEQFLLDHGLNPEETEIINTENLAGPHYTELSHDIWFMDGQQEGAPGNHAIRKMVIQKDCEGDGSEPTIVRQKFHGEGSPGEMEVRVIKDVDDEGNVTMKKFVNGEEVDLNEGDNVWIGADGETLDNQGQEAIFIHKIETDGEEISDEELEKLIQETKERLAIEGDDHKVIVKKLNMSETHDVGSGEHEVIVELLEGNGEGSEGEEMEIQIEVEVDENGEEQMIMWVNGEEVDPADYEDIFIHEDGAEIDGEIEIEIIDLSEGDGEQFIIMEGGDSEGNVFIEEMLGDHSYTIAIVSSVSTDEAQETEETLDAPERMEFNELNINDLSFYPNPTTGQFNLSFELPEKGRTTIFIHDINGQLIHEEDLGRFSGQYQDDFDISHHGPGTYILSIVQGKEKLAEKLIVQ